MKIGIILKRQRQLEDKNVREFAKELGISAPTLSRIENGSDVDCETMFKLMRYLFMPEGIEIGRKT